MKRQKLQIAGLSLWSVTVGHSNGLRTKLWITTPTDSFARAAKKAEAFVLKHYEETKILTIENRGSLDA